jgi:hypothetical protein
MFNAIPASLLLQMAKDNGYMEQVELDLPPCIYIDESKLTDVAMGFSWNKTGHISTKDHPAFTELRESLNREGYIEMVTNYINGDRALKPFYLNNMYFEEGDQFSCATAMGGKYRMAKDINVNTPEYGGVTDKKVKYE